MGRISGKRIWETEHFVLDASAHPHISREYGGHIIISGKEDLYTDRTAFTLEEGEEVMRLSMMAGEAFVAGMAKRGVKIERINYQENGNWALLRKQTPFFHIHLYARNQENPAQPWGEALYFPDPDSGKPYYDSCVPLTEEDVAAIREEMERLDRSPKYAKS